MTHHQMQLLWCLAFAIAAAGFVGMGSNWWLAAGTFFAVFAIQNTMLLDR